MDMSPSAQRKLANGGARARAETLLVTYPAVDAAETAEILRFLKKGPPLEVALMTADDQLKPKLSQLREDHAKEFSPGLKDYLTVAVILIAVIAVLALLWDAGLGK